MSKVSSDEADAPRVSEEHEQVGDIDEEETKENEKQQPIKHETVNNTGSLPKIELKPSDFYFGSTLGEGAFARVVHAKSKKTGTEFAIKIMEKAHIKRENKVKHVLMERKVLTMIAHPFIVKFHFSFQDPEYLFMCMDLAAGGILLDLILLKQDENLKNKIPNKACSLEITQFYTAEIIEALHYLHSNGIIHRDLKPENILIDQIGHIKIADFGTSALCTDNQSPRTSFVGTQDYVSPEVLSGERKATRASDLWAVGCMIYQMLTGISPFRGATEYLTFELIMGHCRNTNPLKFPDTIDPISKDLIQNLLKVNEWERIGGSEDESSDNGYPRLKGHDFFFGIVWEDLVNRLPPYQPDASSFPDSSNMRDGAQEDWTDIGDATPITQYTSCELTKHSVDSVEDEKVSEHNKIWNRFLLEGESQVFTSTIYKRKGLFSKKRQLILTDKPRLIYIDPETMELKGEIPWTRLQPVSCIIKNAKEFDVKCAVTQRIYHLSDSLVGSQIWVEHINSILEKERTLSVQLHLSSSPQIQYLVNRDS